ncbi:MAG TPA: flagellin [Succinivibrionaceae bacterium]|nr:flagellin [Succinivibrionaceae bacterium]
MSIYVNTNVSSLNGQRNLNKATHSLDTTYQRLSSGLRINSAKDDAAGLMISNRLTSQINGLNQGNRNANDGIALAQTCEGAMDEITNMLQRIRTLAVQSANGTNTTDDRVSIQKEVDALSAEITRIACQSTFAGKTFLNGNVAADAAKGSLLKAGKMTFHVGANQNDTISLNLCGGFTVQQIFKKGTGASNPTAAAQGMRTPGTTDDVGTYYSFTVSTQEGAEVVLGNIDKLINYVDGKRADLGALENRLESTITNQSNIAQNESDARSRIRDTDYAEEAANLSQQNIIQQAATSMLTQANSRPQIALSLLG